MQPEAHYPSKWTVATVFIVIGVLIAGIFVWAFYFNKGTVIFQSDRSFEVVVGAESFECDLRCVVSKAPGSYPVIVRSQGTYDQQFDVVVSRWVEQQQDLEFRVIPYLADAIDTLPEAETPQVELRKNGTVEYYLRRDGGIVTQFESLIDPILDASHYLAAVVDQGRLFLVDLERARRRRLFDDSVVVNGALVSSGSERVMIDAVVNDEVQLLMWFQNTSELVPLNFYETIEKLKWEQGSDHRLFVVSSHLQATESKPFLDSLLNSVIEDEESSGLFSVNVDTGEIQLISKLASGEEYVLIKRNDQVFLQDGEGTYREVMME